MVDDDVPMAEPEGIATLRLSIIGFEDEMALSRRGSGDRGEQGRPGGTDGI